MLFFKSGEQAACFALLAVLLVSALSYDLVPGSPIWGYDLQTLWAYQNCAEARENPYAVPPEVAGEVAGRWLGYPPLMYYSYIWMRLMSWEAARLVWAGVTIIALLCLPFFWLRREAPKFDKRLALFWLLLLVQVPVIFTVQRGANDICIMALWTASFILYERQFNFYSGFFAGSAVVFKIYPAFACLVLGLGLAARHRKSACHFLAGGAAAIAIWFFVFYRLNTYYFFHVLPGYAQETRPPTLISHQIIDYSIDTVISRIVLIALWIYGCYSAFNKRPEFAFAGALAICTYFSRTSYDYNLITTYPLLLLLFSLALANPFRFLPWSALLLLTIGVVGSRDYFRKVPYAPVAHTGLQLFALMLAALTLILLERRRNAGDGSGL